MPPKTSKHCKWGIVLEGNVEDLDVLVGQLPDKFLPKVIKFSVTKFGDTKNSVEYLLMANEIEAAPSETIALQIASSLIETINAVLVIHFRRGRVVASGAVIIFDNGKPVGRAAIMRGKAGKVFVRGGVLKAGSEAPSLMQKLCSKVHGSQTKRATIMRLLDANSWESLYKAYEAIREDFPNPKERKMVSTLQLDTKVLKRFTESCQPHRHHRFNREVSNPMTYEEARSYLEKLASIWMRFVAKND